MLHLISKVMNQNILNIFLQATPEQLAEGRDWYRNANKLAQRWSTVYGYSLEQVCGVISALSPACSWDRNKIDAKAMLSGDTKHKFSSYGTNVTKARNILESNADPVTFFNAKTGSKTLNFYKNILNPASILAVTIDRHAAAIYEGREGSGSVAITFPRYRLIAQEYMNTANFLGLVPCELQAIVWTVYRERFVNKHFVTAPF